MFASRSRLPGLLRRGLARQPAGGRRRQGRELPADRAEAMYHVYNGGGVTADGPALLVRKSLADKVSLSGAYYVDAVSNASIDVVTTASPFKEKRTSYDLGIDYAHRGSLMSLSASPQRRARLRRRRFQPGRVARVLRRHDHRRLGYTRALDKVSKKTEASFSDYAKHWQYRARPHPGADALDGWPAPTSRPCPTAATWATPTGRRACSAPPCPERNPRTRTSRALKLRVIGDLGGRNAAACRIPLLLGHLGHQGAHHRSGLQPLRGQRLAGRRIHCACTSRTTRSSTATTRCPRRPTSRATASSVPSRSFGLGGKLTYTAKRVPGSTR
jgi:hypothetical protein